MEMNAKTRLLDALKQRNFFESCHKDSLEKLENALHLEDVIFEVERGCNVDHLFFRYNPKTNKFHRVAFTLEDKKLWRKETLHLRPAHPKCASRQCFNKRISIDTFVLLLAREFEAVAIFKISEKM